MRKAWDLGSGNGQCPKGRNPTASQAHLLRWPKKVQTLYCTTKMVFPKKFIKFMNSGSTLASLGVQANSREMCGLLMRKLGLPSSLIRALTKGTPKPPKFHINFREWVVRNEGSTQNWRFLTEWIIAKGWFPFGSPCRTICEGRYVWDMLGLAGLQ